MRSLIILFCIFVGQTAAESIVIDEPNQLANSNLPLSAFTIQIPTNLQSLLGQAEAVISALKSLPLFGGEQKSALQQQENNFPYFPQASDDEFAFASENEDDANYNYFSTSVRVSAPSSVHAIPNSKLIRALVDLPPTVIPKAQPYLSSLITTFADTQLGLFFTAMQQSMDKHAEFKDHFNENTPSPPQIDQSAALSKEKIEKLIDQKLNQNDIPAVEQMKKYVEHISDKVAAQLQSVEKAIADGGNEIAARLNKINEKFEANLVEVASNVKAIESVFGQNIAKIDEHLKTIGDIIERKIRDADTKMTAFEQFVDKKIGTMEAADAANKPEEPTSADVGVEPAPEAPQPAEESVNLTPVGPQPAVAEATQPAEAGANPTPEAPQPAVAASPKPPKEAKRLTKPLRTEKKPSRKQQKPKSEQNESN